MLEKHGCRLLPGDQRAALPTGQATVLKRKHRPVPLRSSADRGSALTSPAALLRRGKAASAKGPSESPTLDWHAWRRGLKPPRATPNKAATGPLCCTCPSATRTPSTFTVSRAAVLSVGKQSRQVLRPPPAPELHQAYRARQQQRVLSPTETWGQARVCGMQFLWSSWIGAPDPEATWAAEPA